MQPWVDMTYSVIQQKLNIDQVHSKAKERIPRASNFLACLDIKENDLRQHFSDLTVHAHGCARGSFVHSRL